MITGELRSHIDRLWDTFWSGGIANPLEVIEQITYLLFLRLLKPGGRAAVIVPDGVLFGSSKSHKTLRQLLVEEQKLDAVISLPGGVFKPYAGVSTAILLFTKTNSGGTDHVWFYDVDADGMSLDDKRTELLPPAKLGPVPRIVLTADDHAENNLPDILARWRSLHRAEGALDCGSPLPLSEATSASKSARGLAHSKAAAPQNSELTRPRTAQSFCVPKADLAARGYDLSLNRYKERKSSTPKSRTARRARF
jgi:type I restriction enzyme M protein